MSEKLKLERATRYRIYPTPQQEEILRDWEWRLRVLYNVVLEHRFMYAHRRATRYDDEGLLTNAYRQVGIEMDPKKRGWKEFFQHASRGMSAQLTEIRKMDFFKGVPRAAMILIVEAVNRAFTAWYEGRGGKPKFRGRNRPVGIGIFGASAWKLLDGMIYVYGRSLGYIRTKTHRMPEFKSLRRCTICLEAGKWYASCSYVLEIPTPAEKDIPIVGIDRGVKYLIADSDGRLVELPQAYFAIEKRIKRAVRQIDTDTKKVKKKRKKKCLKTRHSANHRKAVANLSRLRKRKSRMLRDLLHKESNYYAERYGVVVLEDLQIANMTKSAKGTKEEPGKNVKQKSGLNRSILERGWGMFETMLEYKLKERGGKLILVPPHYTSQACSVCGHVSKENRKTRDVFLCVECGHTENADINAAKNIKNFNSRRSCGKAACGGPPVAEPKKQESRVAKLGNTHVGGT